MKDVNGRNKSGHDDDGWTAIRPISRPWREVVLVCRKCAKRAKGGFGPDGRGKLRRVLRKALKDSGRKDIRVISVDCLGICPKNAITLVRGSKPGEVLLVRIGTDPTEVVARLTRAVPPPIARR